MYDERRTLCPHVRRVRAEPCITAVVNRILLIGRMAPPNPSAPYQSLHTLRFVTAASLFDGHDAAINIIRRVLQASGAEVIHLGHNRSVEEVVITAIQEDVHGIAISSYQGGHQEYFRYMLKELRTRQAEHVKVFAGGGGVITDPEVAVMEAYGVSKVFTARDGMRMGLQGMINLMLKQCDVSILDLNGGADGGSLARRLSRIEAGHETVQPPAQTNGSLPVPVLGITGTGGAGKSTLTDELVLRMLSDIPESRVAVLSVDPTRHRTGGALLGDRIRMNAMYGDVAKDEAGNCRVFMRSFATRQAHRAVSEALRACVAACCQDGFDLVIVETAGIGQNDTEVVNLVDVSLYVMTCDYGAATQLEKIGMLDAADFVALNKFDRRGSPDALRDIRKQVQRNRLAFGESLEAMPVYPTMASRFNNAGVTRLYADVVKALQERHGLRYATSIHAPAHDQTDAQIIPAKRQRYLGEIVEVCRAYRAHAEKQIAIARKWGQAVGVRQQVEIWEPNDVVQLTDRLSSMVRHWWRRLSMISRDVLSRWDERMETYRSEYYTYQVRGKEIRAPLFTSTLSGLKVPRIALPRTQDAGERLRFALLENLPGYFPFTSGVYPLKRTQEDPIRMFAGEGSPERTNRRFHLVSARMPARRLSTAFDSPTLYGFDPDERLDIYGKVGNAGVSICTLDDMKKLFSGFNLLDARTSVSMTINGPAPMILAMFLNAAIDQQSERFLRLENCWQEAARTIDERLGRGRPHYVPFGPDGREVALPPEHDHSGLGMLGCTSADLVDWGVLTRPEHQSIKARTLSGVRGTVQADILKEDQAQNTCIFSTEMALRMMGDIQQYFVDHGMRNFYSVSVSGYHIAEAGANPITQLAFTLANGFTYVEYYLARGMAIDDFAPNLSFFFSNGMDAEYSVIGRVARRIWAVTMRDKYGANTRSQKLKYHIQTSGRSLHAQEIEFNDIRTTLQALYAIYDNCNSLHTNAYDEAITTPTEESVRRAMAIQLIIGRELGQAKNENPLQGSFIIDELTDLVEEAVWLEFERINYRGGVLGAMESTYQRGKIQDESLRYEWQKQSGELSIVGVNEFRGREDGVEADAGAAPQFLSRSTEEEKRHQIANLRAFQHRNRVLAPVALARVAKGARRGANLFEALMDAVRVCSLEQLTQELFRVGGQYRRSM